MDLGPGEVDLNFLEKEVGHQNSKFSCNHPDGPSLWVINRDRKQSSYIMQLEIQNIEGIWGEREEKTHTGGKGEAAGGGFKAATLDCGSSGLSLCHSTAHASVTIKILIPRVVEKTPRRAIGTVKEIIQAQCKLSIPKPLR